MSAAAPVLAVDVPSGVDASTGEVAALAVRAQATVTFHAAKPGLWIEPGRAHAGRVVVADIGIPEGAPAAFEVGLIRDGVLDGIPRRGVASTKFTSGRVLVAGGSAGPDRRARASRRSPPRAPARGTSPSACPPRCRRSSKRSCSSR